MTTQSNRVTSFSWEMDFTDEQLSPTYAPSGWYQCTIRSIYIDPNYNENRAEFDLEVVDGEQKGNLIYGNLLKHKSYEGKSNAFYWIKFFLSVGLTIEQVTTKKFKFEPTNFVGHTCYVRFVARDKENGVYSELEFYAPKDWQTKKTQAESGTQSALASAKPRKTVSAIPAPQSSVAIPTPQSGFASDNKSGTDILNFLNSNA